MGMVQFMNDYAYAWLSCAVFIPGNVCREALFKGKVFFSLKILSLISREIGYKMGKKSLKG